MVALEETPYTKMIGLDDKGKTLLRKLANLERALSRAEVMFEYCANYCHKCPEHESTIVSIDYDPCQAAKDFHEMYEAKRE